MDKLHRASGAVFLFLLGNGFYLAAFATASVFYMGNVLAHVVAGVAGSALLVFLLLRSGAFRRWLGWTWPLLLSAALSGSALILTGGTHRYQWLLWLHIALALAGSFALVLRLPRPVFRRTFAVAGALCLAALGWQRAFPAYRSFLSNPAQTAISMEEEGDGPKGPFWPSAARTSTGGLVPSSYFLESRRCGECHREIYEQWQSSMHHFASFNNRFYRRSIEHMQELSGTRGSKWCAGCHDHAMLFSGRFERPAAEQIDTPEAQAGLGCVSCHSIVAVNGSLGNGGFTIEYPAVHRLASSRNPVMRGLHDFLTVTAPEPHRRTFMKPFMRDNAEFCSTCHKVHLDLPVNNYRWFRGFNEYDNWQGSGVSGQGARSFYYPEKPQTCGGCHMPLVPSADPAARGGMVHSHRFAAANTAVAHVNGDERQKAAARGFLESGFITVDIFAASPAEAAPGMAMARRRDSAPAAMTTFAVGEEAEAPADSYLREVSRVAAPLDAAGARFQPGSAVRVDVVVRTRKIGHFFPGGTVDAFDVWLELEARDARNRVIYWSGRVEDNGRGAVEPGAHFYRSLALDGAGQPVNKRNAWQARSVLYTRLIPPGAADVAHFRVAIPKGAVGPVRLAARLNYRKFSHYYTQYSFAGKARPGQDPSLAGLDRDSRAYSFEAPGIPDPPIVTLARASAELALAAKGEQTDWRPVVRRRDRERWNDWGIGLLLQGDLKGAEYAFTRVTEAQPEYADGWLNVARALIQEGEIEPAKEFLAQAAGRGPELARVWFFQAQAEKAEGNYDAALAHLRRVAEAYPRDRVVRGQMGRVLFLKRDWTAAIEEFHKVLAVDPEDVNAHYNLMLCYRGAGRLEEAAREESLFRRFKADEAAQALTAALRLASPEDNNERQAIHEHESVPIK